MPSRERNSVMKRHAAGVLLALFSSALVGCVGHVIRPSARATIEAARDESQPRDLFVFLDGTRNNVGTETNVWRLYQLISLQGSPTTRSIYIEGVGSALHPLTGTLLGLGMERRIRMGYEFLAENYRPGDRIYLFGFSRGAHEARALAGMLAFAGLPERTNNELPEGFSRKINRIVGIVKQIPDEEWRKRASGWSPKEGQPALAAEAIADKYSELRMLEVPIRFVGVWDTVPGSFFKEYRDCKEVRHVSASAGARPERYKTDSYPTIRHIAHAVAEDEKRSRFRPLSVCRPFPEASTTVHEVRFPGAHSDVGGGYADALRPEYGPPLSNRTLNWMLQELSEEYTFAVPVTPLPENHQAPAHWSIGDSPGNWFSDCEDREPSEISTIDKSLEDRGVEQAALLVVGKRAEAMHYPPKCCCNGSKSVCR